MKSEIILAAVFSLAVILFKLNVEYVSILIQILIIPVIISLIINLKNHFYWNKNRLLSLASFYYKTISYVAVLFIVFGYAGKNVFSIISIVSIAIYLIIMLLKKNNQESLNAYIYLQITGIFYLIFL
ncbi:MAG: hypothetical protein JW729_03845 [Bacteroidales bacterium]|nr:hypothetical protein [Bacteroidales bacterium]